MLVMALVAAACGDDGGSDTSTTQGGTGSTAPPATSAPDLGPVKVGIVTTLEGPFVAPGEDGIRGVYLAAAEWGGDKDGNGAVIAGREVEFFVEGTDASAEKARDKMRKLIEEDNVDFIVGPLSGDEGIATARYMRTVTGKTVLNGTSAAQDTTLDPEIQSDNFFRFSTDGVQWQAGLGDYAYGTKGYKSMVTIGEDYSFPYSQVMGFMTEYCRAGGHVVEKFWTPIGATDYSSVIAAIPESVDAIYVALGGNDSINFLTQALDFGLDKPLVGGSITTDQSVLGTDVPRIRERVIGTPAAGPIADDNSDPAYAAWVDAYLALFPESERFPLPSLFAHGYYVNAKAGFLALEQVGGDLSDNQAAFQNALRALEYDSPTGPVHVDGHQNGVADIYVTEVAEAADGTLFNKLVLVANQVNQTLGEDESSFTAQGGPTRENPSCP